MGTTELSPAVYPSSGGVGVKGAWVEAIAATATAGDQLVLAGIRQGSNSYARMVFDVGLGAPGAEVVLVEDVLVDTGSSVPTVAATFPVEIPAGSRVSLRMAASVSGQASGGVLAVLATGAGGAVASVVHGYGKNANGYEGTLVDSGATANAKGAWVELTAATDAQTDLLWLAWGLRDNSALSTYSFLYDVGVGAAGAEVIVLGDIPQFTSNAPNVLGHPFLGPFAVNIAAGSRLAVRAQANGADATDRVLGVMAYGAELVGAASTAVLQPGLVL